MNMYYKEFLHSFGLYEKTEETDSSGRKIWLVIFVCIFSFFLVLLAPSVIVEKSTHLVIHNILEIFSVVVSMLVFVLGWNYYDQKPSRNIIMLSFFYLGVALTNLAHLLSYQGMPDFITASTPQKSIIFGVATELLAALALFAVVVLPWKPLIFEKLRYLYLTGILLFVAFTYWIGLYGLQYLPNTFVEGQGLTDFKKGLEYIIIIFLFITAVALILPRKNPQPFNPRYLLASVIISILSRISFSLYVDVTDMMNLIAHVFKFIAYLFIFKAVVIVNIQEPFKRIKKSEQALNQSKQWLLTTLTSVYDGVIITNVQNNISFMNRTAEILTGWKLNEVMGGKIEKVFSVSDKQHPVYQVIRERNEDGYIAEMKLNHRDGRTLIIESSATLIKEKSGREVGVILVFRDITSQKEREKTERRLSAILEATPDFVATANVEGKALYYNKAARKMLGIRPSEDISIDIRDTHTFESAELVIKEGFPTAAKYGTWQGETIILSRDGTEIPVNQVIIAHKNCRGEVEFFSTVARDITEQRQAEERQRLATTVLENITEGVMVTTKDNRIVSVNPAFTQLTGYDEEEVIGHNPNILSSGKHDRKFYENMWISLQEKGYWKGEIWNRHHNGKVYLEEITINSVNDKQGNVIYYVGLFKDITEQKRTEELLKKSDRLAVVGQLAAGMAHEIRNPLTSIRGFIQLLQSKSTENKQYYKIMISELDRINIIVSELLVLAKPQAVRFDNQDIHSLLNEVIMLFDIQSVRNNIQIKTHLAPELPLIYGESNQLKQVFINIMKNAIEAMTDGGIITVETYPENKEWVVICFHDEGAGIPEDDLNKLGEPFYSTKEKGTGLGLMISHKIIEDHKGRIEFTSKIGKGTTVKVFLPVSNLKNK